VTDGCGFIQLDEGGEEVFVDVGAVERAAWIVSMNGRRSPTNSKQSSKITAVNLTA
jgi:cold shock CspA family protein